MSKQRGRSQLFWEGSQGLGALPSPSPKRLSIAGTGLVEGIARAGQAGGAVIVSELSQVREAFSSAGTALFGERPTSATLDQAKRLLQFGNLQTLQNALVLEHSFLPNWLPRTALPPASTRESQGRNFNDEEEAEEVLFTVQTNSPAMQRPRRQVQKQSSSDAHPFLYVGHTCPREMTLFQSSRHSYLRFSLVCTERPRWFNYWMKPIMILVRQKSGRGEKMRRRTGEWSFRDIACYVLDCLKVYHRALQCTHVEADNHAYALTTPTPLLTLSFPLRRRR